MKKTLIVLTMLFLVLAGYFWTHFQKRDVGRKEEAAIISATSCISGKKRCTSISADGKIQVRRPSVAVNDRCLEENNYIVNYNYTSEDGKITKIQTRCELSNKKIYLSHVEIRENIISDVVFIYYAICDIRDCKKIEDMFPL